MFGFVQSPLILITLYCSNTSLIAPLIIGQNSHVGAGSVITQNVPPFSLAIERNEQRNILKKTRKNTKI